MVKLYSNYLFYWSRFFLIVRLKLKPFKAKQYNEIIKYLSNRRLHKTDAEVWWSFMYKVGTKSSTLTQYKNTNQINNSKNAASERLTRQMCGSTDGCSFSDRQDDKMRLWPFYLVRSYLNTRFYQFSLNYIITVNFNEKSTTIVHLIFRKHEL